MPKVTPTELPTIMPPPVAPVAPVATLWFSPTPKRRGCAQDKEMTRLKILQEVRGTGVPRSSNHILGAVKWSGFPSSSVRGLDVFQ